MRNVAKTVFRYYFGPLSQDHPGRPLYRHGPFIHRMTLGYVILAVAITVGLYRQSQANADSKRLAQRVQQIAKVNRAATCRQRRNYELAAAQTQQFLSEGGHIPGVEDALLVRGMRNNLANAKALEDVQCNYKPVVPFTIRNPR